MKLYTPIRKLSITLGLFLAVASPQASAISINLNFTGGLTVSQQTIFTQAELYWEGVLTGYQPGINIPGGITIDAAGADIDGVGGVLGSAGPTTYVTRKGYALTTDGLINFDIADLANLEGNGSLEDVILHEMAHVLGFGTLWELNGLYDPAVATEGKYIGAAGLAAYNSEFGQSGTFIPIELGGGTGTAGGHWNEVDGGGSLTGITDGNGNDMRDELMTGWLNPNSFISDTTKLSFIDLGYTVNVAAVPVPAAVWLFISGFTMMFGFARKRQVIH